MPDPKAPVWPIRPPHRGSAESRIYVSTNESNRFVGHFGIRPLNKQVPFRTVVCSARSFCRVTQKAPDILKLYGSEFRPDKAILGSGERLLFHFSAKMSLPEVVRAFSAKVAVLRVVQLEMDFTSVPLFSLWSRRGAKQKALIRDIRARFGGNQSMSVAPEEPFARPTRATAYPWTEDRRAGLPGHAGRSAVTTAMMRPMRGHRFASRYCAHLDDIFRVPARHKGQRGRLFSATRRRARNHIRAGSSERLVQMAWR
jgi:hypothetical protein